MIVIAVIAVNKLIIIEDEVFFVLLHLLRIHLQIHDEAREVPEWKMPLCSLALSVLKQRHHLLVIDLKNPFAEIKLALLSAFVGIFAEISVLRQKPLPNVAMFQNHPALVFEDDLDFLVVFMNEKADLVKMPSEERALLSHHSLLLGAEMVQEGG